MVAVVSVVDWEVDNALLNVARGEAAESCRHTPSTNTDYTGTGTSTVVCGMQNERYAAARTPRVLPVQIQVQLTVLVCSTQDSRTLC